MKCDLIPVLCNLDALICLFQASNVCATSTAQKGKLQVCLLSYSMNILVSKRNIGLARHN
jgi:hypothetical protein